MTFWKAMLIFALVVIAVNLFAYSYMRRFVAAAKAKANEEDQNNG